MTVSELIGELQRLPGDAHVMLSNGWPGETVLRQEMLTHIYTDPVVVWVEGDEEDDHTDGPYDGPSDGDLAVWLATHPGPDECEKMGIGTVYIAG